MIPRHYAQLLVQVLRDRAAGGLMVRLSWFLAACVVGELVFAMYFGQPRFGHVLLIGLICGTGYLWCGAFLKSAIQQNQPAYACLVPQLRRRLMTLTVVLYLACTLVMAAMASALIGHGGYALVCGGMFSVYMLFAQRYALLNLFPSAVILVSVSMRNQPLQALVATAEAMGEPVVAGVGAILLLLLGRLGLQAAFPQGGDRHWAWYAFQARQLAQQKGDAPAPSTGGPRWIAWFRTAYLATLRRDSRGGASQGNMMMHTLGTAAHDGTSIAYVVLFSAIAIVIGRHLAAQGEQLHASVTVTLMQASLMLSCLMYVVAVGASAARNGVEQSLYLLTPAAPEAARINAVLLRTLLWRCLRLWLISLTGAACIDFAVLGRLELRGPVFVLAMLMLPCAGFVLRNYAVMPARQGSLMATGTAMLGFAAVGVQQLRPELPWYWIGGGVALVAVAGMRWRWRRMMALPPLLPAGRLAA
jgi:hypothetical protein